MLFKNKNRRSLVYLSRKILKFMLVILLHTGAFTLPYPQNSIGYEPQANMREAIPGAESGIIKQRLNNFFNLPLDGGDK